MSLILERAILLITKQRAAHALHRSGPSLSRSHAIGCTIGKNNRLSIADQRGLVVGSGFPESPAKSSQASTSTIQVSDQSVCLLSRFWIFNKKDYSGVDCRRSISLWSSDEPSGSPPHVLNMRKLLSQPLLSSCL